MTDELKQALDRFWKTPAGSSDPVGVSRWPLRRNYDWEHVHEPEK